MSLNTELTAMRENFYAKAPRPIVDTIRGSVVDLKSLFDPSSYCFLHLYIRSLP
jgi:hypothetical protein